MLYIRSISVILIIFLPLIIARSISVILIIFLPLIIAAEEDTPMSIGQNFHHQTGFGDSGVKGTDIKFGKEIPLYKTYPGVPRFKLPVPTDNNMTVEKAIADRQPPLGQDLY